MLTCGRGSPSVARSGSLRRRDAAVGIVDRVLATIGDEVRSHEVALGPPAPRQT